MTATLVFFKSHIKEHASRSKTGRQFFVKEHEDKRSKQEKFDVTKSEAFKKWFGNSKVVDKDGKPLRVYHGSKSEFGVFDLSKVGSNNDTGMWGTGFYFSPIKKFSLVYGDKLKHVYLSLQNPYIIRGNTTQFRKEFHPGDETHGKAGKKSSDELRKRLIAAGYDGVIQYEPSDKGLKLTQIVAFYPTQIKSTNNRGTFDPKEKDITKSLDSVPA